MLKKITALLLLLAISGSAIAQSQEDRIAALEKKVKELETSKITGKTKGGIDLSIYGFVRLDAMWTDSSVTSTTGNGIFMYSNPESSMSGDNQLGITARNTRFGLDLVGPSNDTLKSSAKIELDFSGRNDTEQNNHPRIRHGYIKLDMPESKFSVLAGQTWDVVAPVIPPTIDCSILWWQGNIGMRRSQLRLSQGLDLSSDSSMLVEGALTRTIGKENNFNNLESGSDAGVPTVQGRVSVTTPVFNDLKSTFGVSGHYGKEEYDITAGSTANMDFHTWSMAFDMTVPLTKSTKVLGEIYQGSNCGTYAGAVNQTVTLNKTVDTLLGGEEIDSMGGWVALAHTLSSDLSVATGFGLDTADPQDLVAGNRQSNQTAYANIIYKPLPNTMTGFELAYNKTEYMDNDSGETVRASMFMQFNF